MSSLKLSCVISSTRLIVRDIFDTALLRRFKCLSQFASIRVVGPEMLMAA